MDRFTFGDTDLMAGFALLPVLIGVFAVSQVLEEPSQGRAEARSSSSRSATSWPTWLDLKAITPALLIGWVIGVIIGIMPGTGGAIACFLAYNEARRWSKKGACSAGAASRGWPRRSRPTTPRPAGRMVPMLTLGVPGDVVTAVMLGALMLIGVRPGPLLFAEQPVVVYTLLAGLIVMQFLMLGMGFLSAKFAPRILKVPNNILMPVIMVLCVVGAFTLGNRLYDVLVALGFGRAGAIHEEATAIPGRPWCWASSWVPWPRTT